MNKYLPFLFAATSSLMAAPNYKCSPKPPAPCNYTPQCGCQYCLGPAKPIANAPVCPKTCGGDFIVDVSALYWISREDGLEYAILDDIFIEEPPLELTDPFLLNQIVKAKILSPKFKWNWGFKAGIGYASPCDGWDLQIVWTGYKGRAYDDIFVDSESNTTLLNLWSSYNSPIGTPILSREIETSWTLKLNLVDFELGRDFWTSKYLSLRPFVGVRVASLRQNYDIVSKGGSFSTLTIVVSEAIEYLFPPQVDFVKLSNDYRGAGIRAGLGSCWNVGCGFALYGNAAASLIYGRFDTEIDESIIFAATLTPSGTGEIIPFGVAGDKTHILDHLYNHFRASKGIVDLVLGIQWASLFCDCKYGFTAQLGWEEHLFFHQNQFWSISRINGGLAIAPSFINTTGENLFQQRRGTLYTGGLTLTMGFEF